MEIYFSSLRNAAQISLSNRGKLNRDPGEGGRGRDGSRERLLWAKNKQPRVEISLSLSCSLARSRFHSMSPSFSSRNSIDRNYGRRMNVHWRYILCKVKQILDVKRMKSGNEKIFETCFSDINIYTHILHPRVYRYRNSPLGWSIHSSFRVVRRSEEENVGNGLRRGDLVSYFRKVAFSWFPIILSFSLSFSLL